MEVAQSLLVRSLDALEDVFYIYDEQGHLVYWNQRLNDLFGFSDDELAGMTPTDFFVESDKAAVERAVMDVFETGRTVVEAAAETENGTIQFQLTAHLLTDGDGETVGFSGIGRDVTERGERERYLARENERLDDFVSVVSHDLRNPLTVLDGSLRLARETGDPAEFERSENAIERMALLIEDLLTLARRGEWVDEETTLGLQSVVEQSWAELDTAEATLVIEGDCTVNADKRRLKQLLSNLFGNAVTHAGPDVTVTVGPLGNGFFVADDGPGIPLERRETVFDPGQTTTTNGIGLGLSIVEQIVRAHGWSIELTDSDGGGARFEIRGVETT